MKYNVKPIPPGLSPLNAYLGRLLRKEAVTVEDAEAIGKEIETCFSKLFTATVDPMPPKEDYYVVYKQVTDTTNKSLKQAGWFRKPRKPDTKKGSSAGYSAAQTTQ